MIDRQRGKIIFECDTCSEVLDTDESDFDQANAARREAGWTVRVVNGEWEHYCSERCANV